MSTIQINAGLAIKKNIDGVGTTAQGFRRALAAFFTQTTPGVPAAGRLGADNLVVAGTAGMTYTVSAGYVVIVRPGQGVYIVPLVDAVTLAADATSGVNPRWDRIYIAQPDPELDGTGVDPHAVVGVVSGLAAASPGLPALPPGSLELARTLVPGNATRTDALTFTNVAPVTSLNLGGTLPVGRGGTGATTKAQARANLGFTVATTVPPDTFGDEGDITFVVI